MIMFDAGKSDNDGYQLKSVSSRQVVRGLSGRDWINVRNVILSVHFTQ